MIHLSLNHSVSLQPHCTNNVRNIKLKKRNKIRKMKPDYPVRIVL